MGKTNSKGWITPTIIIVVVVLILASVFGRGIINLIPYNVDTEEIEINAPGLKGIGTLSLGMTTEEAITTLKENSSSYKREYKVQDEEYEWFLSASSKIDTPDYEEKTAEYYLDSISSTSTQRSSLTIRLGFYRDTLVLMRISGGWRSGGAGTIHDALKDKYGDGVITGIEKTYGQKEVWRSEYVEAEYFRQDDHNKDWRKRKILEYMEITPATRNIWKVLSDYNKELYAKIAAKEEEQKQSVYDKI